MNTIECINSFAFEKATYKCPICGYLIEIEKTGTINSNGNFPYKIYNKCDHYVGMKWFGEYDDNLMIMFSRENKI